jgi:hypothetical protein
LRRKKEKPQKKEKTKDQDISRITALRHHRWQTPEQLTRGNRGHNSCAASGTDIEEIKNLVQGKEHE